MKTTEPLEAVFDMVRKYIEPWKKDRYMSPDIEAAASLIQSNKILNCVKGYMDIYNEKKATSSK